MQGAKAAPFEKETKMTHETLNLNRNQIRTIKKLAAEGDAGYQAALGCVYHARQDYKEAMNWHRRAAAQGHAEAQTNIGMLYMDGEGVEQDHAEAAKWFLLGAEQGDRRAQNNLGAFYMNGTGVERDLQKSMEWLKKAAVQGHTGAAANIDMLRCPGCGKFHPNTTH
jgi:TPR repeat protein